MQEDQSLGFDIWCSDIIVLRLHIKDPQLPIGADCLMSLGLKDDFLEDGTACLPALQCFTNYLCASIFVFKVYSEVSPHQW